MKLLSSHIANVTRCKYIETFIDTNLEHYRKYIKTMSMFKDGLRYEGYLWDCFKTHRILSHDDCIAILQNKSKLYLFWDLHSCENILIENYWKYPIDSVVELTYNDFLKLETTFPEDIYLFDDTFQWTIAYTHEDDLIGNRLFYFCQV